MIARYLQQMTNQLLIHLHIMVKIHSDIIFFLRLVLTEGSLFCGII